MKLNRYLLGSTLVAALGGLLFGFDTAVISGATKALRGVFQLDGFWLSRGAPDALCGDVRFQLANFWFGFSTPETALANKDVIHLGGFLLGFTVASALIGTIVGSLLAGKPAERFGRKPMLYCLAVLYFVSALGCGLAPSWWWLVLFRFVGGLAIGGASVIAPMYIAEISPPQVRGRLVAMSQLNVVLGILVAYASNYLIDRCFAAMPAADAAMAWRWMLGVVAVPAAMFFCLLTPIPESPRWLVKRHRRDEALGVLRRLGNDNAAGVLAEIVDSLHEETVGAEEPFFRRKYRTPILLAFMVATFNQMAGINAIIYYTNDIFEMAGAGETEKFLLSVAIGFTNLVFTLVAMSVIDRFGRKLLLMIGAVGLAACLATTAYAYYYDCGVRLVLASLIGYIAFFAFSQGSVIWVFLSEIFPNRVRARGQALGSFTHWFWCAVVTWIFPVIAAKSAGNAFAFFAAMMVLQLVMVWKFLPETKGVSLEAIQRRLGIE
jgi:MFS transporter, SP family, xylose:H+ symportor